MNGCEALRILFVWLRVRFIFYIILLCSHTKIDDDKIDHQEISTFTDDEIVYGICATPRRTIQSQRVQRIKI